MILPILIVALAGLGAQILIASRPSVPQASREDQATFVEVLTAHVQDIRAVMTAYGTVHAHQQISVQAEVSGLVVQQNPDLVKGGLLPKGVTMIHIDARDYKVIVDEKRAALAKAEFELTVELGNQAIARREWNLLRPTTRALSDLSKQLALRHPHLQEKRLALQAAKSRLAKARLDVDRTILKAPFNALVLSESVDIGQLVNTQHTVATLVGTDECRVQVSVPIHQLPWIVFPGSGTQLGSRVRLIRDMNDGEPVVRHGRVVEQLGDVTSNGHMAQVSIAISDPLDLQQPHRLRRPLLLGEYVRVTIDGPLLHDVIALPRETIHEGNRVWVKNADNQLEVRPVEIVLMRKDSVLITQGITKGEQIITSHLPAAIPGLSVQSAEQLTLPTPVLPASDLSLPAPISSDEESPS